MRDIGGFLFLGVFGLFWCSFVFFVDGMLAWNAFQQLAAVSYATTTGTITKSDLELDRDSDGTSYRPHVHYRYEVGGVSIEGKRVRYDATTIGKAHAESIVDRYPHGKVVAVHYNSSAPEEAVLELGLDSANLLGLLFLTPFNAVAFGFAGGWLAWIRSKQLGRPILGVHYRDDVLGQRIRIYAASPTLLALAAGGGMGFVSVFGYLLLTLVLSMHAALIIGWIATLSAALLAWWYARKNVTEIRHDALRGRFELRAPDGSNYSAAQEDLRPVQYTKRVTKDSDGDRSEKYPLSLTFFDAASQQNRSLSLPDQSSEADAKLFANWMNGVLGVANDCTTPTTTKMS